LSEKQSSLRDLILRIEHPDVAQAYGALKQKLCKNHPNDREAYTRFKTDFVARVTLTAKKYYAC